MKNILVFVLVSTFILSGFTTSCGGRIVGSGNMESVDYDYTGFTMIEAGSGFEVTVTRASNYSIKVTTDDNVREHLEITRTGDILEISLASGSFSSVTLEAEITMPGLAGINLSGGSRANISGFNSANPFSVTLSEGSELAGDIVSGDAGLGLSGGSRVTLRGLGGDLLARSSGGSNMILDDFRINNADINIDGGGTAIITVNGRLDTVLTGGSQLLYSGEPEMGDVNISGGSSLEKR